MMPISYQTIWIQLLLNLSKRVDERISFTNQHSFQVAQWVAPTSRQLKCSKHETHSTYWAALLHDVGKIGVPDEVLSKPGPLTHDEWTIMRLHPTIGASIVRSLPLFEQVVPVIQTHQERFDGSGYPSGLKGNQIPLGARILAVVDAFDAMTNDRCYRRAFTHQEAVNELVNLRGKDFDPHVVHHFLEVLDTIPTQEVAAVYSG